jgi:hypothetical protein
MYVYTSTRELRQAWNASACAKGIYFLQFRLLPQCDRPFIGERRDANMQKHTRKRQIHMLVAVKWPHCGRCHAQGSGYAQALHRRRLNTESDHVDRLANCRIPACPLQQTCATECRHHKPQQHGPAKQSPLSSPPFLISILLLHLECLFVEGIRARGTAAALPQISEWVLPRS